MASTGEKAVRDRHRGGAQSTARRARREQTELARLVAATIAGGG